MHAYVVIGDTLGVYMNMYMDTWGWEFTGVFGPALMETLNPKPCVYRYIYIYTQIFMFIHISMHTCTMIVPAEPIGLPLNRLQAYLGPKRNSFCEVGFRVFCSTFLEEGG